jgi:DnaD/phage-associated family protein
MNYKISFGSYPGVFALPAAAADQYINEASQSDLKVLLYIFRHSGEELDDGKICKALDLTAKQLLGALEFWSGRGFFGYTPAQTQARQETARVQAAAHSVPHQDTRQVLDTPMQYGQEEIAVKAQSNPEIKFLFETVPNQLGRLISPAECSTLIYLYEGAGLPVDVIIMLVGYCVSFGKGNMRYIEKMGVGFAEEGIDTHEKAEKKIHELEDRRGFEGKVRTALGISDRALSPTERQHVTRWSGWALSVELVREAYDICVSRTGKLSFAYMNTILSAWHDKGFATAAQARGENKKPKAGEPKSPSYDIDEYVRLSMKTLHNE